MNALCSLKRLSAAFLVLAASCSFAGPGPMDSARVVDVGNNPFFRAFVLADTCYPRTCQAFNNSDLRQIYAALKTKFGWSVITDSCYPRSCQSFNNSDLRQIYAAIKGINTAAFTANEWRLNGNTVGSEKWLGTVDNYDLPIRTNNTERLRLKNDGHLIFGPNNSYFEFQTGTTAIWQNSATGSGFNFGFGDNSDLDAATVFARSKYSDAGFSGKQVFHAIKGSTGEAYYYQNEVGVSIYANAVGAPTIYNELDINHTASSLYFSNGATFVAPNNKVSLGYRDASGQISFSLGAASMLVTSANASFPGVQYTAATSNQVTTNQTLYSILDRTNGDARWSLKEGSSSITTVGTVTAGTWNATKVGLAYGGTNADLSATGGASQVLKQTSAGADITVGQLAASDLSNGTVGTGSVVLSGADFGLYLSSGNATTTSTVAATVGEFTFTIAPNKKYIIHGYLSTSCSGAGGTKYQVDVPGTSAFRVSLNGNTSSTSTYLLSVISADATLGTAYNTVNGSVGLQIDGTITSDGTGGAVSLGFASTTAGQTSTVFAEGSFLIIKQLN